MNALAVVFPPSVERPSATLATLTISKSGWLGNVADNIFTAIRKDFPKLIWTVNENDENLTWFFDKADGSIARNGNVLFWYGVEDGAEIAAQSRAQPTQARAFSTLARRPVATTATTGGPMSRAAFHSSRTLRLEETTNPNPPLGRRNATNEKAARIALIGARGYTGQALIGLLNAHPHMDLRHVSSRELAGQRLEGYDKSEITYESLSPEDVGDMERRGEVDAWVMALPNGVCKPYVDAVEAVRAERSSSSANKSVIIDLSADYRFDSSWTYGLPELVKRETIRDARRIANPGCYATAAQLGIAPLLAHVGGTPVLFGVSGYSGAGTKPSPKNDVELLTNNLIPYSLTDHVHEREISSQLGRNVAFTPHVAVWFQGIHHTIHVPLRQSMTSRDIRQMYQDRYAGEKLVKIVGEPPLVKSIQGKHGVEIGGFAVHSSGRHVVICVTIDNLLKGAATQCLQNLNLALGYAEYEGIPIITERKEVQIGVTTYDKRLIVMIELDGRTGEGGGQLVRIAAALAAVTGQAVRISNVRGNRRGGGLKAQHVSAIEWLAMATGAAVQGLAVGSSTFVFEPGPPSAAGHVVLRPATAAASTSLMLQAVLPYLVFRGGDEGLPVVLHGGTHVAWAPSYDYLDQVLFPVLETWFGIRMERALEAVGWSAGHAGRVRLLVHPIGTNTLTPRVATLHEKVAATAATAATIAAVDATIRAPPEAHDLLVEALARTLDRTLAGADLHLRTIADSGRERKQTEGGLLGLCERIAREVVQGLAEEVAGGGCGDTFLQDQVVVFQALAAGRTSFWREEAEEDGLQALRQLQLSDAANEAANERSENSNENPNENSNEAPSGQGSLHAQTARWVTAQMLAVPWFREGTECEGAGWRGDG
ncbi:RNA cyclase [Grosmannia clavigera kw1407]|uniref:RNA cyclase n=1 Tax=Grosmannia clavigera (strain kw1407 / UAMH 11150) TaxID=655863 RepID=F0XJ60_GROCL|nr:RNA cyclase [Grosmannia clavigera kw1407]EFX02235.1 RNA cyclase [Grosmannia clavigera kw1407]